MRADFPGEDVAVRGTVATLAERFPFWPGEQGQADMQSVLDILRSGSDTGKDKTMVGPIHPDGELNEETGEWLGQHIIAVVRELDNDPQQLAEVFPILIVYRSQAFSDTESWQQHRTQTLVGAPAARIAAVYITDRIVPPQSRVATLAQQHIGTTALA